MLAGPFDVMDAGRMSAFMDPTGAVAFLWQAQANIGQRRRVGMAIARPRMEGRFHGQVRLEQPRHAYLARTAQERLVRADEEIDLGLARHA